MSIFVTVGLQIIICLINVHVYVIPYLCARLYMPSSNGITIKPTAEENVHIVK
jgi:hypothetical protein